jgi:hypothetical protein
MSSSHLTAPAAIGEAEDEEVLREAQRRRWHGLQCAEDGLASRPQYQYGRRSRKFQNPRPDPSYQRSTTCSPIVALSAYPLTPAWASWLQGVAAKTDDRRKSDPKTRIETLFMAHLSLFLLGIDGIGHRPATATRMW